MARNLILGDRDPAAEFGTPDDLVGTPGDDFIDSGHQQDTVSGGGGNDILTSGGEGDLVHGGDGDDIIDDVPNNSGFLAHKSGNQMFGDAGDDILIWGGIDNSVMTGGEGADTFRILPGSAGSVRVTDFTPGVDVIELYSNANGSGILTPEDVFDHLIATADGTELRYDLSRPTAAFGNGLFISGLSPDQLDASDFRIVEKNPHAADPITLRVSGDHFDGDPQFQLVVDGVKVGAPQSVTAVHANGEWQEITIPRDSSFTDGPHFIEVNFINDARDGAGGLEGHDRNLYIDWVKANGLVLQGEDAANNAASGLDSLDPNAAVMVDNGTAAFYAQSFRPSSPTPNPGSEPGSNSGVGTSDPGSVDVTIHGPADIHTAADGARLFREVASDDAIKEPMAQAHARLSFSADHSSATGTAGRDLVYFTPENPDLQHVAGGAGDDVYVVQFVPGRLTGGDPRIVEAPGGGEDTVWVSQSDYILPNGVENLVSMTERGVRMLANDGANKFIGGSGDDQLFSGFGDDIVYGREGDDLIVGGDGTDALFGGAGRDTFAWELDHVGDNDRIMDWEAGIDRLDLHGLGGGIGFTDTADGLQVWLDHNGQHEAIVTLVGVHNTSDVSPFILS